MKISVYNKQRDLKISSILVKKLLKEIARKESISFKEMAIYFVTKKMISSLHNEFFKDPSPTDCISFPYNQPSEDLFLGEIFVCPKVAIEYSPKNPYAETMLYIVHGFLHLIGYDDLSKKDKNTMRKKEKECISFLNKRSIEIAKKKV